jgi:hypothetical protein
MRGLQQMSDIKEEQLVVWYYSTSTIGTTFSLEGLAGKHTCGVVVW